MANLAGFMPQPGPGTIYGGDWSQPYSGIMDTLLQAQQAGQQRAWDQSLSGPSFNRRFGGMLPPSLNMPSAPVQQQADPQMLAALQGALAGSIVDSGNGTQMMEMRGQPVIAQGEGSMQSQPWYNDYLTLARSGGPLPTVYGNAGGLTGEEQRGIDERRAARLAKAQAGTLPMEDRRANVRNNAIAETEQRKLALGKMSPDEVQFRQLNRLQGQLGGPMNEDAQFMWDVNMYGVDVANENRRMRLATVEAQAGRDFQRQMQQEQLAAGSKEKEADRTAARDLQAANQGFQGQEGDKTRATTMTAAQLEAQNATDRLKAQLQAQLDQFRAEQQAREATAAASTTQHQETLAANKQMNDADNKVQMAKIAQDNATLMKQEIGAVAADPNFYPNLLPEQRYAAAAQVVAARNGQSPAGGGQPSLSGLQGPLQSLSIENLIRAPEAGSFEDVFTKARQQYPNLTGPELAAEWQRIRGYNPYDPMGEVWIPGIDLLPDSEGAVRARRLNQSLGYDPGHGIPSFMGNFIPQGASAWIDLLRGSPQSAPQPAPQQFTGGVSHNTW